MTQDNAALEAATKAILRIAECDEQTIENLRETDMENWREAEAAAQSIIAAYTAAQETPEVKGGEWRWVPVEPTDEMTDAAADASEGFHAIDGDKGPWLRADGYKAAYQAMLAAAPSQAVPEVEGLIKRLTGVYQWAYRPTVGGSAPTFICDTAPFEAADALTAERLRADKAERELKTVLDREAATALRHDEKAEAQVETIRAETVEACAKVLEQVVRDDDDTDLGERAAEAFNDLDNEQMNVRLRAWNTVLANGLRALTPTAPKEPQ